MSDAAKITRETMSLTPGHDELLQAIVQAVVSTPGVVRLEPTISTAGPKAFLRPDPAAGVRLMMGSHSADVDVNVATRAECQARAVAHQIQQRIHQLLQGHGYLGGQVSVSVLSVEV